MTSQLGQTAAALPEAGPSISTPHVLKSGADWLASAEPGVTEMFLAGL